jgi:hypothetical protein
VAKVQADAVKIAPDRRRRGDLRRLGWLTRRIWAIWALVRMGASRLRLTASSNSASGLRSCAVERSAGSSASNPPARQARIQRSSVLRLTLTLLPSGPRWSRSASWRTSTPRWRVVSAGSAASRTSE